MQAVILAAGRGKRMDSHAPNKPLMPVLGIPLLERAVRTVQTCGITEIIIVTGYGQEAIQRWYTDYSSRMGAASVTLIHNKDWATTENGASLLAAAPKIKGAFLLLMADHIYTPELIRSLCAATLPEEGAVLATDGNLQRTDIDLDDVTRVRSEGNTITHIDKGLERYNGFDTGAFLCSPVILELLQSEHDKGRTRISDTMQILADKRRLVAQRVDGMYWQDVDTPAMHARAEEGVLRWAAGKTADGFVARQLNRPLSRHITRFLASTRITPNQVSLIAFATGLVAAFFLAAGHYWGLLLGGILVQFASVIDGCDGELARVRLRSSNYGGWLDALLDRYADAAILAGLTWHAMILHQSPSWMWLGILAISGSFVASYSAHKADTLLPHHSWRIGRDTRSLIIMIGALLALPVITLGIIVVIMNSVVAYRIFTIYRIARTHPDIMK